MKKNLILLMAIGILSATASFGFQKPVTIKEQGSFMAGGTVVTSPGEYKDSEPMNFDGETLHGDHAYVFYQKPVKAKKNSIVFLHGYGQSGKSWESTPDGRDGFQNIFLEKGYRGTLPDLDIPRMPVKTGSAFGNAETGGAWLSTARVVRCWVKSRNERNPCC